MAENSTVWRSSGTASQDRLEVFGEAHVEHLVGLVEDDGLDRVEAQRAAADVVERAARAWRRRRPRRARARAAAAGSAGRRRRAGRARRGRGRTCAWPRRPASRARAWARAPARRAPCVRRWSSSRCRIGSANAAVLPVPVAAWPSRSRPASSGGIASRWIGVGSSYPRCVRAASSSSRRPRSAKVVGTASSSSAKAALTLAGGVAQFALGVVLARPRHHGEESGGTTQDEHGGDGGHAPIIGSGPENLLKISSRVP